MKRDKHDEILKEVLDEIETASKDKRGLVAHQRRLAFSLSLGAANLLELYFHKLDIAKEGSSINHVLFKRKKERISEGLERQITSLINSIPKIDDIIQILIEIEKKRDDLAYGAPSTEKILQEKINLFFKLKEMVEC